MTNFFFFNDTATTEIYTLSLHDALPIFFIATQLRFDESRAIINACAFKLREVGEGQAAIFRSSSDRSEEHTSELQSPCNLVCRLLLEKKNFCRRRFRLAQPFVHHYIAVN